MTDRTICGWPDGTASTGPHVCGRKAKFYVSNHHWVGYCGNGPIMSVCGIHANKARRDSTMTVSEGDSK